MEFNLYINILKADLYRNHRATGFGGFLRTYRHKPGFRYVFWMRTVKYVNESYILKYFTRIFLYKLHCLQVKYGISISHKTQIGPGFFIGHFGGIVVNGSTIIGRNCNIAHGVTIAQKNRGKYKGCPVIGDNVYIGPGSCILGGIKIGSNAAIGAHAVVVHDIVDNEVVVGNPARVVSKDGSKDYVNYTLDENGKESNISDYEHWRGKLTEYDEK